MRSVTLVKDPDAVPALLARPGVALAHGLLGREQRRWPVDQQLHFVARTAIRPGRGQRPQVAVRPGARGARLQRRQRRQLGEPRRVEERLVGEGLEGGEAAEEGERRLARQAGDRQGLGQPLDRERRQAARQAGDGGGQVVQVGDRIAEDGGGEAQRQLAQAAEAAEAGKELRPQLGADVL